jgi:hypothetical protein
MLNLNTPTLWRGGAAIGVAVALGIASFVLLMNPRSGPASDELTLQGISSVDLASRGLTLKVPPAEFVPKVDKREIESSRTGEVSPLGFDLPIREIVLAQVADSSVVPPIDRVLWVVNLDVTGVRMPLLGPAGSPQDTPYLYSLFFVDPETGGFVYSASAGAPIK